MAARSLEERASGVLLHPTSLPGPAGIGDLGAEAHAFVDFLAAARQGWWMMLPVNPAGGGNSPYSSPSTFAGNPWLLSLEQLADEGLLERGETALPDAPSGRVDYGRVIAFKGQRLAQAGERFLRDAGPESRRELEAFCSAEGAWLEDYALFTAIASVHGPGWLGWPPELAGRDPAALERARDQHRAAFDQARFAQFQFQRQWHRLAAHARERGVGLIGDLPIFVTLDSADVWANRDVFDLDEAGRPRALAGVPPDYFSATGQLWGNPLYRWRELKAGGYDWWLRRLRKALARADAVRLDHFIGFQRYWAIPSGAATAAEGRWRKGPGGDFFESVFRALPGAQLIAEDLGSLTPEVERLRDRFKLPGMRVLQFAFGDDNRDNPYRPHAFVRRTLVFTGTHDNDTTAGWFAGSGRDPAGAAADRARVLRYLGAEERPIEIHWEMIRLAWMSVANLAIVPAQDLLGLGPEARLNRPGEAEGNWSWRLAERLPEAVAARLRALTETYGRDPIPAGQVHPTGRQS